MRFDRRTFARKRFSSFSAATRRSLSVHLERDELAPPSLSSPVASSTASMLGEKSGSQGESLGDLGANALGEH